MLVRTSLLGAFTISNLLKTVDDDVIVVGVSAKRTRAGGKCSTAMDAYETFTRSFR